jgi:signal recognition particle receptor subunit beta
MLEKEANDNKKQLQTVANNENREKMEADKIVYLIGRPGRRRLPMPC